MVRGGGSIVESLYEIQLRMRTADVRMLRPWGGLMNDERNAGSERTRPGAKGEQLRLVDARRGERGKIHSAR